MQNTKCKEITTNKQKNSRPTGRAAMPVPRDLAQGLDPPTRHRCGLRQPTPSTLDRHFSKGAEQAQFHLIVGRGTDAWMVGVSS